ncbi:hypothetical protein D3C80_1395460 [compost metagenome]
MNDLAVVYDNIDIGCGIGKDYEGGRVTIVGNEYPYAIPTSPIEHEREGTITLDLSGLNAVRFVGLLGADAFPGDEAQRRATYAVRTQAEIGRFITIVEPYEADSMIEYVQASDENTVEVSLKDGRRQVITLSGIEGEELCLQLVESKAGQTTRQERATGK